LYLASEKINGKTRYFIRESYRQGDHFLSRDLIDLGAVPGSYIVYPGGNSFYIDQDVEDRLSDMGTKADPDEIEDIFWPFVHPEIRRILEPFRSREKRHQASRRKKRPENQIDTQVHIFDKRRMHYLRFGQMNQRDIGRLPLKFFRILHDKSRDEVEQALMAMETVLTPREYKAYAYVIFDLQQFFYESYAKNTPKMLSIDRVDEHFIGQICRLNSDRSFWAGMKIGDRLHNYLVRYVLMYFDHDFAPRSLMEDYLRQFINSRRDSRAPYATVAFTLKKASTAFGEPQAVLKKMNRKELARLYRLKALDMHPDKGGDHDEFVKLTEAYHALLKTKN
jgi:hypothetical protein